MQSREKKTPSKSQQKKSSSMNSVRSKKRMSPARPVKVKQQFDTSQVQPSQLKKKAAGNLFKKKIEDLKAPDLIIKVSYKGKRIAIPIAHCDEKGLNEVVMPHIIRFEKEILINDDFEPSSICNWKTLNHDILKDYYFQTNKSLEVFRGELIEIEPIMRRKIDEITLQDFEIIRCIGTGGFSRVFLTRLKATGAFYALKLIEKEGLFVNGKQCVVTNERDIMVDLQSRFVLKLQFAFQTKHFVALALEYCPGGQLFFYLRKVRKMSQEDARYCFVEILLGIQYLHSKNIIYRDIKPENIMIDMDGNLKIADFGLSKARGDGQDLAMTYCGSPEYMAPEMLAKSGHGFEVDYYCLGALLYELVTGNPPFYSRDVDKIYQSIQNDEITFPDNVELSHDIKMLLEKLLEKDPKRRLGSMGGIREILGHPWVRKLKAADIINQTVPTPIKIDLLSFNINEDELEEGEDNFLQKLGQQGCNFKHLFEDFYFERNAERNILEEALPSVKSESTKQNKSSQQQYGSMSRNNTKLSVCKSSLSREKSNRYAIDFNHVNQYPSSEVRRDPSAKKNNLKKQSSKKKMRGVEPAKQNIKNSQLFQRVLGSKGMKTGLKRIKSSTALLGTMRKQTKHDR